MPTVTITCRVPHGDAGETFARISDFPSYADHTDAVREVRIDHAEAGTIGSTWSVNFRNGVLRWSEQDRVDPHRRRIDFTQTAGDFAHFAGHWRVEPGGDAVDVEFGAEFDLGMPSLAALIDPIAEQTLDDNMRLIIRGLLGDTVRFTDTPALAPSGS